MKNLRERGFDAERLRLSGNNDEGDLVIRVGGRYHVIECKNVASWTRGKLEGFMGEAVVEAINFSLKRKLSRAHPALFLKRAGKGWSQSYVVLTMDDYLALIGGGDGQG